MSLFVLALFWACEPDAPPARVRVTVVAVLAGPGEPETPAKLAALAAEVRESEPKLTRLRLEKSLARSIPIGGKETFALLDDASLEVTVEAGMDARGRVTLTIVPPKMKPVRYACRCGKYFPLLTPHATKAGERLVIGVMGEPCHRPAE